MATAAELKVILSASDNMSGTIKAAGGSLNTLQAGALNAGKALLAIGATAAIGGIAAVGAGLGFAVKAAADFEAQMSAVSAVSGATQQEMADLSTLALKLGADTSFSATEAGQGIEELVKAGVSLGDVMGGAAAASLNLAAAGAISVSEAATITSNALNAFGLSGENAGHVADVIAGAANASAIDVHEFGFSLAAAGAVANTVGFSFDDLATAIAVMGQAGIKGSDAGTSLKTMMLNLQPATDKQIALFDKLGITTQGAGNKFFDATGKVKSMAEVAQVLQTALGGMTEQQRLATLETIFGSDAIRAGAVLTKAGAAGFNEMAASMAKVTAESVANERLNNLQGSLEKLQGSLMTAAIAIGTGFLPGIRAMADGITTLVNDNMPAIQAIGPTVIAAVGNIGASFMAMTDTLYQAGQAVSEWASTVGAQVPGVGPIIEAAGAVAGSALTGLAAILRGDINAAIAAFTQAATDMGPVMDTVAGSANDLATALGPLIPVAAGVVAAFATFTILTTVVGWIASLVGAWSGLMATFGAAGGVIAGIVAILGGPITVALLAVAAAVGVLTAAWIGNWGDIQGITESAVAVIGSTLESLASLLETTTAAAFTGMTAVAAAAWDSLNSDTQAALSNLAAVVGEAWNSMPVLITGAMAIITGAVTSGWAAVTAAVDVAMAAITAAASAGWSAVQAASDAAMALIPPTVSARFGEAAAAAQAGMDAVVSTVAGAASAAGAAAAAVGSAIVSGLSGAIQAGVASVANAAANLVSSAIGAARAAAQAQSPSKKTYELGQDLVEGLRQGLGADGAELFADIIAQFGDFVDAAREYRGVAETILQIEEDTKDFRSSAQLDAIRREWEMVDVVSEHLRLKRDLIAAERDLLPARQAAANADRQIQEITRGSLAQRQELIKIDAERDRLKIEELKLEERLVGLKRDSPEAKQIQEQLTALRDKDKLLGIQAERIKITNDLAAENAKINREALIEAVKNGEAALVPTQQMIELLEAEIAVWKSNEATIDNITKNFVNSQSIRIAAIKDESAATADRIKAGTDLVAKLEEEGLISTTTAGKLRDLAKSALEGKSSSAEFMTAINSLITAMGGESGAAVDVTKKVEEYAGTAKETVVPATNDVTAAASKTVDMFDNHMGPAIEGVAGNFLEDLKPAAVEGANAVKTAARTEFNMNTSGIDKVAKAFNKLEDAADDARDAMKKAGAKIAGDVKKGVDFVLGFAHGGIVPGTPGSPQPAIVHGGEMVLTREQQSALFGAAVLPTSAAEHYSGMASGASGGVTQNFTFNIQAPVYGVNDMEDVVIRSLERAQRRGRA